MMKVPYCDCDWSDASMGAELASAAAAVVLLVVD